MGPAVRPRILFVFTSASESLTGQTGWYLPEAAHPYYVLKDQADIDFASPAGPDPPVDEYSVKAYETDELCVKFLKKDEAVKEKFAKAQPLESVQSANYDAVFYVGGHGPVIDLANNLHNAKIVSDFWGAGKIIAAVCHGPAALILGKDKNDESIVKGRRVTCFSNAEEDYIGMVNAIPFLVEDKLKELGGIYECAPLFKDKVVVHENLITGQNPESAESIGKAILAVLSSPGMAIPDM